MSVRKNVGGKPGHAMLLSVDQQDEHEQWIQNEESHYAVL